MYVEGIVVNVIIAQIHGTLHKKIPVQHKELLLHVLRRWGYFLCRSQSIKLHRGKSKLPVFLIPVQRDVAKNLGTVQNCYEAENGIENCE